MAAIWLLCFFPDHGGIHVLVDRERKTVRCYTRGGLRKTYPTLPLQKLPEGIFAAELLTQGEEGWRRPGREHPPTHVFLHDVWYLDGKPLMDLPFSHRLTYLQQVIRTDEHPQVPPIVTNEGEAAHEQFFSAGASATLAIAADAVLHAGISKQYLRIEGPGETTGVGSILLREGWGYPGCSNPLL